jgi:hypothetical protein
MENCIHIFTVNCFSMLSSALSAFVIFTSTLDCSCEHMFRGFLPFQGCLPRYSSPKCTTDTSVFRSTANTMLRLQGKALGVKVRACTSTTCTRKTENALSSNHATWNVGAHSRTLRGRFLKHVWGALILCLCRNATKANKWREGKQQSSPASKATAGWLPLQLLQCIITSPHLLLLLLFGIDFFAGSFCRMLPSGHSGPLPRWKDNRRCTTVFNMSYFSNISNTYNILQ